jgi:hypothetical protein
MVVAFLIGRNYAASTGALLFLWFARIGQRAVREKSVIVF